LVKLDEQNNLITLKQIIKSVTDKRCECGSEEHSFFYCTFLYILFTTKKLHSTVLLVSSYFLTGAFSMVPNNMCCTTGNFSSTSAWNSRNIPEHTLDQAMLGCMLMLYLYCIVGQM